MRTQVKDLMKKNPVIIPADTTLKDAAKKMKSVDCGILPVGTKDKIEGIITDRDIVIRGVAEGVDVESATVSQCMTSGICCCSEEDTLDEAAEQMRRHDVSRLLVKDNSGQICGILTFGSILRKDDSLAEIGKVVESAIGRKVA